jgi:hypothetical protein
VRLTDNDLIAIETEAALRQPEPRHRDCEATSVVTPPSRRVSLMPGAYTVYTAETLAFAASMRTATKPPEPTMPENPEPLLFHGKPLACPKCGSQRVAWHKIYKGTAVCLGECDTSWWTPEEPVATRYEPKWGEAGAEPPPAEAPARSSFARAVVVPLCVGAAIAGFALSVALYAENRHMRREADVWQRESHSLESELAERTKAWLALGGCDPWMLRFNQPVVNNPWRCLDGRWQHVETGETLVAKGKSAEGWIEYGPAEPPPQAANEYVAATSNATFSIDEDGVLSFRGVTVRGPNVDLGGAPPNDASRQFWDAVSKAWPEVCGKARSGAGSLLYGMEPGQVMSLRTSSAWVRCEAVAP